MRHVVIGLLLVGPSVSGRAGGRPADAASEETVQLDFPEEVEVQALVDYASQTLGLNILYDESIRGKKVTIRSPAEIPKGALLGLIRSALRIKSLALLEDDQAGWLKVTSLQNLPSQVGEIREAPTTRPAGGRAVTQVIPVNHADLNKVTSTIKPFMTTPGGSAITVEANRLLILTDYEATVKRIMRLIELVDVPGPQPVTEMVDVRCQDPTQLAARVSKVLQEQARVAGIAEKDAPALSITADAESRILILIGPPEQVERARRLIDRFDVRAATETELRRYVPRFVSADRVKGLIEQVLGAEPRGKTALKVHLDAEGNTLYVSATAERHGRIRELIDELDTSPPEPKRPVRFYRLVNRRAAEVLETLTALLGEGGATLVQEEVTPDRQQVNPLGTMVSGPNRPGVQPAVVRTPPVPPAQEPARRATTHRMALKHARGKDFSLTADEPTNTLIVVAAPEQHSQIEKLVQQLDRRPPQVLVEMTLVSITTSDSLALGIELESLDLGDGTDYLLFSTFGLSAVDPATGSRAVSPAMGLNGVLLTPSEVPVILQALATRAKSRVLAAPRILVNDNGTGTLSSVQQAPFTSINASDTVATTSFAGFADAGTTVTVTPHIGDSGHMELDYQLTFSSFTGGAAGATTPPPRSSNTLSASVVVPDGYTVVVGGLVVENESDSINEVPLLGRIPLLGLLFQSSSRSRSRSRIYAFIRPVILRDQGFEDLRLISAAELEAAGLENNDLPPDQPMWMR